MAGVSYLITIITGVFAEVFVRGSLVVRDDAAATAANLLAHESLYRLGLVAGVIEVTLTGLIVMYAWKWPKQEVA